MDQVKFVEDSLELKKKWIEVIKQTLSLQMF